LETAQWLWILGGVDIHARDESAFRMACRHKQIEVAKWLVSLGDVDVHVRDYAFLTACRQNDMKIAKWLVSLGGVDIHVPSAVFNYYMNLDAARWLSGMDPGWEHWDLSRLKTWRISRAVWMRACIFCGDFE
jgi:hypothetical protein